MEIEKNIPIPKKKGGNRTLKYPWDIMEVNESCFFPGVKQQTVSTASRGWVRRNNLDKKFTTREVTENGIEGVRVWRVK